MSAVLAYVITGVAAYLLGSISTGILVSKTHHGPNLREVGSKNTGASNVLRTMGKRNGLITFLGDCGKAALACLIGRWLLAPYDMSLYGAMLAGLIVIIGHNWPMFFQFKGGKGIAVAAACLWFVFGPVGFFIEIAAFALGIAVTRCVSVGSIAAAAICPLLALYFYWGQWVPWLIIAATACVVIWAHRANIARLRAGTENKIGSKKTA